MPVPSPDQSYHSVFRAWVKAIEADARRLSADPEEKVACLHRSLQRLRAFMEKTRRQDRDYRVMEGNVSILLSIEEIPLDREMKWLCMLLSSDEWRTGALPWHEMQTVLVGLMPFLAYAGDATAAWYQVLDRLRVLDKEQCDGVLRAIFETGRREGGAVAQLAMGVLDYIRHRRRREEPA